MTARNRSSELRASTTLNGVDFVELDAVDPTLLRVHFFNTVEIKPVPSPGLTATVDGGDSIPTVPVAPIVEATDWSKDLSGRPVLSLRVPTVGDFSDYRLTLEGSPLLDRMFRSATFSFKAFCPSDFDCEPDATWCPPDETPLPAIDYLAKDYLSFRRALTEFSSQRYPDWRERSEADFGMMFAEALSALADELSYQQDRIAAEATLETATQRGSVIRHARLVDYEPRPATSARTLLVCQVGGSAAPAGVRVSARTADGDLVPFEIGTGLEDKKDYLVSPRWNGPLAPYWWDDDDRCLKRGATEMWLAGHGHELTAEVSLLIRTELPGESLRQVIALVEVAEEEDGLFLTAGQPTPVTRIRWRPEDALLRERDQLLTALYGNLLPATQGERRIDTVAIDTLPSATSTMALAIARYGPNGDETRPNWVHRHPLAAAPLAWLADAPDDAPRPEVSVRQTAPGAEPWKWARNLLDADSLAEAYTVEPIAWRPVARDDRGRPTQWDIDGDQGESVRFGDGVFGAAPEPGSIFEIGYRTGAGAAGNVAADSITEVDPAWGGLIGGASNPFAAAGGADAESLARVRRLAPQAFRAKQYRAVRSEDYVATAEELPWVQKAGNAFRWTGSWFTGFTAADPIGSKVIGTDRHIELVQLLDRRRMAGVESYAPAPRYVSVDLEIEVCVKADSLPGAVEKAVVEALADERLPDGRAGFFFADAFTFGSPLHRSRLEAAIQAVAGVAGVLAIRYRKRGALTGFIDLPDVLPLAVDEILRIDNDPDWPERGVIRVYPEGGR